MNEIVYNTLLEPGSRGKQLQILVVEDDEGLNKLVCRGLRKEGLQVQSVFNATDAIDLICKDQDLLLLLDYKLPDITAKGLIEILQKRDIKTPFIVMTGFGDQKIAVEMMKLGARDYIVKDTDFIERLPQVIKRALKELQTEQLLKNAEKRKLELETQLHQAQKMEAMGVLAGGVAHDFNNLLTTIHGYCSLAIEDAEKDGTIYPKLQQVKLAAERAANLTRQLLLFSRRQTTEKRFINLNDILDGLLKMLRRMIGEDIVIETLFNNDLETIEADAGNIEQIIMNLAVNARDAMPKGGTLRISTKNAAFSEKQIYTIPNAKTGKYVCFSVSDTGTGMDAETIQHIFEPFYTTKEPGKGTGLGLSVVYGIVSNHGGWINVSSEPGEGTTFSIFMPSCVSKTDEHKKESVDFRALKGNGEHILVVEDEEDIRGWSAFALRENGYLTSDAGNATEAMAVFENNKDEIVMLLSDVVMPGKSGLQLAEQLVAQKPGIKIIFSSGYPGEKSQYKKIREQGMRFLQKPFTMIELLSAVKEVLGEVKSEE
jgi:signal transduction histidine kinase